MKVRMLCNYILPKRDDMVSLVFQTEPGGLKFFLAYVLSYLQYDGQYDAYVPESP